MLSYVLMASNNDREIKKEADEISRVLLMLGLASFSLVASGSLLFKYLEDFDWLDSVYFSVVSLTTVGYGDITPVTDAGKIFTMFYLLAGIGLIGATVNTMARSIAVRSEARKNNRRK